MKTPVLYDFMNLRKPVSHITIISFSLIVTIIFALRGEQGSISDLSSVFIMAFVQLEVFIFVGNKLFAGMNFDKNPGEITRIILFRFAIFLAICLLVSLILFLGLRYSIQLINRKELSEVYSNFIKSEIRGWFKSTITGLSAGALIFIVLLWQSSLRREQKLKEEKLIFQNETLKNQVNPHFLFNSLNTISALVQNQPDIAEKFINNLSSFYRYILENGQKDKVPLRYELDFITKYFNLHKIRDEEKINLEIEKFETGNYEILPVSLQILIENAIKHNLATRDNPLLISVYKEGDFIVVKNNLQKIATRLESTKTGLKNLSERVRLVSGKDLSVEETSNYFIVKLPLL